MKEIKIGFIGCGGNARGHMRTLTNMEGARVVATCDLVEDLAKSAAEASNAEAYYTNHKVMLERQDLDAIYLSLPVFAHGEPELDTIARGLPFFVEKPVAISMEIAKRVEESVEKSNTITCVGYQLRYSGSADIAKEILSDKTINMVAGKYWCGSGRGSPDRWLRQMSKSGGQLVEQATHTIDMIRYIAGEVTEVYALQTNRVLPEIDCPDVNCLTFRFANGALGSLSATWAFDPADWSNANVLDILYEDKLLHWEGGRVTITGGGEKEEKSQPGRSIDAVFVEAVRNSDPSIIRSPYSDAVKSLAISLAANESGARGVPVMLS